MVSTLLPLPRRFVRVEVDRYMDKLIVALSCSRVGCLEVVGGVSSLTN